MRIRRLLCSAFFPLGFVGAAIGPAHSASIFTGLGTLDAGESHANSEAHGVSASGLVVVGGSEVHDEFGQWSEPFRWTSDGGIESLGKVFIGGAGPGDSFIPDPLLDRTDTAARDVSADGSLVVGSVPLLVEGGAQFSDEVLARPFLWQGAGIVQTLGTSAFDDGIAEAISPDGLVMVGSVDNATVGFGGQAWSCPTAGGGLFCNPDGSNALGNISITDLDGLSTQAADVSADGVLVGTIGSPLPVPRAFFFEFGFANPNDGLTIVDFASSGEAIGGMFTEAVSTDGQVLGGSEFFIPGEDPGVEQAFISWATIPTA